MSFKQDCILLLSEENKLRGKMLNFNWILKTACSTRFLYYLIFSRLLSLANIAVRSSRIYKTNSRLSRRMIWEWLRMTKNDLRYHYGTGCLQLLGWNIEETNVQIMAKVNQVGILTSSFWYVVTAMKVVSGKTYVEQETLTPSSVSSTTWILGWYFLFGLRWS